MWKSIGDAFLEFNFAYAVEWILLFALIYYVMKTLNDNNAKRFTVIYGIVDVAVGVAMLLTNDLSGRAVFNVTSYLVVLAIFSLFFLLLFATEIKRSIWTVKHTGDVMSNTGRSAVGARAEEYITSIVRAVQNLSKNNTGALIVLSNGNLPKEIVASGVALGSQISSQLIEGIFVNKAPLHDGAMIIYGDKIQAAGCFLPLTQREFPKDFGTRHRAGIGVTEVADVSTIIVSEETGIVSVVKRGGITRYADSEVLKKFLREYYWKEFNAEGGKQ